MMRLFLLLLVAAGLALPKSLTAAEAPTNLNVYPQTVDLCGARAAAQALVTGQIGDRTVDLTRHVTWTSDDPSVASVDPRGYIQAVGDGSTIIHAHLGEFQLQTHITAHDCATPDLVSFADEIIPVLNRAGCNMGACHGTPNGKGGFKLSLRGYDIPFDYKVLTRDVFSRRISPLDPDGSLILKKAMAVLPHQGGKRFEAGSQEHQLLRQWIAEGLQNDPADTPHMQRLEIFPPRRTIKLVKVPSEERDPNPQQLKVMAHFDDGSVRDVTRLCAFSTSDDTFARVGPFGLVEPLKRGEVAVLARFQHAIVSARFTFLEDRPGFVWTNPPQSNVIDQHVDAKLHLLQIPPSGLSADHVFLRRAYLDAIGALPSPKEVRAFLADNDPDKRTKLIDYLLERPEFADFWTLKWADILRLNEKFMDSKGLKTFHGWIRDWVAADKPMDAFVRELMLAQGGSLEVPPINFYRTMVTPEEMAETVSQLFMGVRMNCAKCHNHPFEKWTQDDYYGLAAVFAEVDITKPNDRSAQRGKAMLKLNKKGHVIHPRTNQRMQPQLPGNTPLAEPQQQDWREPFVDWLTAQDNPFFARTMANRIWFHLLGRGIVDPVDDFRESNPASNDELLDALTHKLVASGYRLKPIVRLIMNSRTYQASAIPNELNRDDAIYFSRALPRLLTAEQMLDAVCKATEVPEKLPMGASTAVQIPGAKINNPFLKTFNRPDRNLACECERERSANLSQALQMISSGLMQEKVASDQGRVARLLREDKDDASIVEELYLATLARYPSRREQQAVKALLKQPGVDRREVFEDVAWTLMNSKEFQYQH